MPAYLNLSDLSRRELENPLLTVHSAYLRTLATVREQTDPGWKVRREVERIAQETVDRRPFARAFVRLAETRQDRARNAANAAWWGRWRGVEA
jgi:hypothetical protein